MQLKIPFTTDKDLFSMNRYYEDNSGGGYSSEPQPIDIGNVKSNIEYRGTSFKQNRPLYEMSPVYLKGANEYVNSHLKNGNHQRSKPSYGAPLFLMKDYDM